MQGQETCLFVASESFRRRAIRIGLICSLIIGGSFLFTATSSVGFPIAWGLALIFLFWKSFGTNYQFALRAYDFFTTAGVGSVPVKWTDIESYKFETDTLTVMTRGQYRAYKLSPFDARTRYILMQHFTSLYEMAKTEGPLQVPEIEEIKIESHRLEVKPLTAEQEETFLTLKTDPTNTAFQLYDGFAPEIETENFQSELDIQHIYPMEWSLGIFLKGTDQMIGYLMISLHSEFYQRKAQLGIAVLPEARNKGFASEAIIATLDYIGENTNLIKVSASCFTENKACAKTLENAGMTYVGLTQKFWLRNGKWHDSLTFEKIFNPIADTETADIPSESKADGENQIILK